MEKFLELTHNLKNCFSNYEKNEVLNMSLNQKKILCIDERLELNRHLFDESKLSTSNLIRERLNHLENIEKKRFDERRAYLDSVFK